MKYILVTLLVIHGLIHLLGFVKAFDLAQPAQLQMPISPLFGLLWLSAALLLYEKRHWSTPVRTWRTVDGRKLFSAGEAVWQLPTGEFAYGRFDFAEVQYNVPEH